MNEPVKNFPIQTEKKCLQTNVVPNKKNTIIIYFVDPIATKVKVSNMFRIDFPFFKKKKTKFLLCSRLQLLDKHITFIGIYKFPENYFYVK